MAIAFRGYFLVIELPMLGMSFALLINFKGFLAVSRIRGTLLIPGARRRTRQIGRVVQILSRHPTIERPFFRAVAT